MNNELKGVYWIRNCVKVEKKNHNNMWHTGTSKSGFQVQQGIENCWECLSPRGVPFTIKVQHRKEESENLSTIECLNIWL